MSAGDRVCWHKHAGPAAWTSAAATQLAATLRDELGTATKALLLVSGGSTPEPVYRALAAQPLEWTRVVVGLVDERYLPLDHPASNARLLDPFATAGAQVWPLLHAGFDRDACAAHANARLRASGLRPCAVVFGMGEDGHTASLFPDSIDLEAALASEDAFVGLDTSGCKVAGNWTQRITLTPAGWRPARTRLLLLRGERKHDVLAAAISTGDRRRYPILYTLSATVPLHVHWSP